MRRAVGIVIALFVLVGAAPAHAATVSGSGTDAPDAGVAGGRDIVGVSARYDDAGSLTGTITLREAPSVAADGLASVFVGTAGSSGCAPDLGVGAFLDPAATDAAWTDGATNGPGQKSVSGATLTVSASGAALGGFAPDCATATVTQRGDPSIVFDRVDTPVSLSAPPPPPPPAPTPTPEPPPPPAPPPAPKVAKLALEPARLAPVKRGKRVRAKVTIRNTGTATARDVRLKITAPKALALRPRGVKLGALVAGRARTVVLRMKAKRAATLRLAVTARDTPRATSALALRLKARKRGKGRKRPKPGAPLARRYYTDVEINPMGPNIWTAVAFLDGTWAYRGIPETPGLPTCSQRTAGVDADGDPTDGCVPYTYDPKRGKLTIDGQPATMKDDRTGFTLGEAEYAWAPLVKAGTRFEAPMETITITGYWPYQAVSQKWFTFSSDGHFAMTSQSFGSFGIPGGIAPYTQWASIPPDQRGSYEFGGNGELKLTYADGDVDTRMVAILRSTKTGSADIVKDGFLFGDEQFWLDDGD